MECVLLSHLLHVSHLYAAGEEPSFSAQFCECYRNQDERHDQRVIIVTMGSLKS